MMTLVTQIPMSYICMVYKNYCGINRCHLAVSMCCVNEYDRLTTDWLICRRPLMFMNFFAESVST